MTLDNCDVHAVVPPVPVSHALVLDAVFDPQSTYCVHLGAGRAGGGTLAPVTPSGCDVVVRPLVRSANGQ